MQPLRGGYLIAAGGTGGHITPGLAVAAELRSRHPDRPLLFIGTGRDVEQRMITTAGYDCVTVSSASSADLRKRPLPAAWRLWQGLRKAKQLIAQRQPRAIIGCGGYGSLPLVCAARRMHVPVVLLEQNVVPGRATRWLSRRTAAVCVSFAETVDRLGRATCHVTGNPVRSDFHRDTPGLSPPQSPQLLILGGSLGSLSLNQAICRGLARHAHRLKNWSVIHQTGPGEIGAVAATWRSHGIDAEVVPFLDDPARVMVTAAIAVTRGGATTLAELAAVGVATIIAPWRNAADDHQLANANWYAERDAAIVASDPRRLTDDLWSAVSRLAEDEQLREDYAGRLRQLARPEAAARVADVIDNLSGS